MASSRIPARRRILLTAVAACGVALVPSPGVAAPSDPSTSAEAAQLVAARAHDLEVVSEQVNEAREQLPLPQPPPPAFEVASEQFNEPREQLALRQAAVAQAAQQVVAADAAVTAARRDVRS